MKPRILLLSETPGWALDTVARATAQHLSETYDFDILYSAKEPEFDASQYDLIHVLLWSATYYRPLLRPSSRVVKSIYSHRYRYAGMSPMELYHEYLREAHAIAVPTPLLKEELSSIPLPVHVIPEGVDTDRFTPPKMPHTGQLVIGWAGNENDPLKQIDVLKEACAGIGTLRIAGGALSSEEMTEFYREIDVIVCSSLAEGCPRPLLEGMACGAFPVSFPVGIAPEVIHSDCGILVEDRTVQGLRSALEWCNNHRETVRAAAQKNREIMMKNRQWSDTVEALHALYHSMLSS